MMSLEVILTALQAMLGQQLDLTPCASSTLRTKGTISCTLVRPSSLAHLHGRAFHPRKQSRKLRAMQREAPRKPSMVSLPARGDPAAQQLAGTCWTLSRTGARSRASMKAAAMVATPSTSFGMKNCLAWRSRGSGG